MVGARRLYLASALFALSGCQVVLGLGGDSVRAADGSADGMLGPEKDGTAHDARSDRGTHPSDAHSRRDVGVDAGFDTGMEMRPDADAAFDAPTDDAEDAADADAQTPTCTIDGGVVSQGRIDPANECESCQPTSSTAGWSFRTDGTPCSATGVCCSGTCVDETADPSHCGACSTVCAGGASAGCSNRVCNTTVVTGLTTTASPLVTDGQNFYWGWGDYPNGGISSAPFTGGTPTNVVSGAANSIVPYDIALDSTNLYWESDTAVMKIAKGTVNGTATTLFGGTNPRPLTLCDGYLVFGYQVYPTNYLYRIGTTAGGGVTTLTSSFATSDESESLSAAGLTLYWPGNEFDVLSMPIGGSTISTLSWLSGWGPLIATTNTLYVDTTSDIVASSLDGSTVATLASGSAVGQLALGTDYIFWSGSETTNAVVAAPLSGGATITLWTGTALGGITAEGNQVYWSTDSAILSATPPQ